MVGFRPEYIDAVSASRWNIWLIPLFLLSPTLFTLITYKRTNVWVNSVAVIACTVFTWLSLCFYTEHIWNTMELNAQTDAEWQDVTADSGRLVAPFLVGVPFAIVYTLFWFATCSFSGWAIRLIYRRFTTPKQFVFQQTYTEYRKSLVREYTYNANEPPSTSENTP